MTVIRFKIPFESSAYLPSRARMGKAQIVPRLMRFLSAMIDEPQWLTPL
jgi:hypothetical protein